MSCCKGLVNLPTSVQTPVIGGGPAGGCAADTLASNGIETVLIERKLDNAKPCGGAIPLCMIDEFQVKFNFQFVNMYTFDTFVFQLPAEIIDRKVTKMKMISPSNVEVDVGKTLSEREYIGMCRR